MFGGWAKKVNKWIHVTTELVLHYRSTETTNLKSLVVHPHMVHSDAAMNALGLHILFLAQSKLRFISASQEVHGRNAYRICRAVRVFERGLDGTICYDALV